MIREATRRRRRSRSASPGRSKRARSRSRDRRVRDVGPPKEMERMMEPPRREKGGRSRQERHPIRSRERELDNRHGRNSLTTSGGGGGGGMRGGRERPVQVHVRDLPPVMSDYRGGGGGMPSGRGVIVHQPQPYPNSGGGRMDIGRGGGVDFRGGGEYGGGGGGMNGHGRGGYPVAPPRGRSGDRERDREREAQRERERARDREKEKERVLFREREERARVRVARAAADLRAAEAVRHDKARLRDEAAAQSRGGSGGAVNASPAAGGERAPRLRARDRGRDRAGARASKGKYMNKQDVDALFLKVIKTMAAERCRFPCTASLINDRMKQASTEDYNVANSEYTRFSNVLARFEADKIVSTTKSRDSIQVLWTKYSPAGSGSTTDTRGNADSRRRPSEERKTRASRRDGPFQLYFCAADEVDSVGGAEGGPAETGGAAVVSYAEIATLLQERGEVLTSLIPKKADTGSEVPAKVEPNKVVDAMEEDSAAALAEQSVAPSAESTDTDEDVKAEAMGATNDSADKDGEGKEAVGENPKEVEKTQEQVGDEAAGGEGGGAIAVSNGNGVSAAKEKEGGGVADADVYTRDMALLRSANGLVAEVSTPSSGVGFKIALMIHQRCKPCLCLFYRGKDEDGTPKAVAKPFSPMLKGDRNLDYYEYSEASEIGGIVDGWIEKRFPRRYEDSRARGGRKDGSGKTDAGGGRKGEVHEQTSGGVEGSNGTTGRRGDANDDDDNDNASVDNNNDSQSMAGGDADRRRDGGGGGAESVVSNEDDHEEVEDVTGDHAAAAAAAAASSDGGDGSGTGRRGAHEGDISSDNDDMVDAPGYDSAAEQGGDGAGAGEDDGDVGESGGEHAEKGDDGSAEWLSSEEEKRTDAAAA